MNLDSETVRKPLFKDLTGFLIRTGLVVMLVLLCIRYVSPFADLFLWALILAVALYPLHLGIVRRVRGRRGLAATLLVVIGLLLIGGPIFMLGESFGRQMHKAHQAVETNAIIIQQPDPSVADWPLIGDRVYAAWNTAANDLPGFLEDRRPQLKKMMKGALSAAADTTGAVLVFLGSLVIAGIIMTYGESGSQTVRRILQSLTSPATALNLQSLSTATIRSVANGVGGVAFIQALLMGIGFFMAGIPAAGVLALVVLLIGIVQLPALIISLPIIAYMWWAGDSSAASNIFFSIYFVLAGMADNFLKPLLLGRGVDAPMPVILLGALGGMVTGGIVGLFVGAVVLAVGYTVFMAWVDSAEQVAVDETGQTVNTDQDA